MVLRLSVSQWRRWVIAQRMVESYLTAATFTHDYDVDMTEMLALRKKVLEPIIRQLAKSNCHRPAFMAVVRTLMKHHLPQFDLDRGCLGTLSHTTMSTFQWQSVWIMAWWHQLSIMQKKWSLSELVVAFKDVIGRILEDRSLERATQNSTFTISNLGMFGVQSFGQSLTAKLCYLGASSTVEKPVVVNGRWYPSNYESWLTTIDHRVVDGMAGAKLRRTWRLWLKINFNVGLKISFASLKSKETKHSAKVKN